MSDKKRITVVLASTTDLPDWITPEMKKQHDFVCMPQNSSSVCFLTYMLENYDNLSPYTVFLQKDPFKTMTVTQKQFIHALNNEPCLLYDKTYWTQTLKCVGDGRPHHPGLKINEWFIKIFQGQQPLQVYEFTAGAQFMLSKERITMHAKPNYESILKYCNTGELDDFTMERLWNVVIYGIHRPPQGGPVM
jgi:hypothetical protein